MHYLFLTSLLAALDLAPFAIAKPPTLMKSAWREDWGSVELALADIPWKKYNSMTWAFAGPTANPAVINLDPGLSDFVTAAHENHVEALVSIGGANNSTYFSSCVNPSNTQAFVEAVKNLVKQYDLDGVEFDWEYPAQVVECNQNSPDDSANYLRFLTQLRQELGTDKSISLAVSLMPFLDSTGVPTADMSAWAKVVDYITIMDFDVFGSWSHMVGPNSPLNNTGCAPSDVSSVGCGATGVIAWMKAGFPSHQIVLGVPSYGHGFNVPPSEALKNGNIALFSQFSGVPYGSNDAPQGSPVYQTNDQCGTPEIHGGTYDFRRMITVNNFLTTNGTHAEGTDFFFDLCSYTPYIYIPNEQVMISYDNADSFAAKGRFIRELDLKGFKMWHVEGDYNNILVNSITSALNCGA